MVGGDHDDAAGLAGLVQQRQQQAQIVQRPALVQLVRAAQVVVHRVVDHADDPGACGGQCRAHRERQVGLFRQITLVEQPWRCFGFAVGQQGRVADEFRLLLATRTGGEAAAKQAGPADLGDGGQGGHTDQRAPEVCPHHLGPAQAGNLGQQLPADARAQPVHHQQQHRLSGRQWGQHLLQHPLDRHGAAAEGSAGV